MNCKSNRDTGSKNIVRVEFPIVLNVVVVNLGADKQARHAVPNVIAQTGAEVLHEVIAAGKVDATDYWVAA